MAWLYALRGRSCCWLRAGQGCFFGRSADVRFWGDFAEVLSPPERTSPGFSWDSLLACRGGRGLAWVWCPRVDSVACPLFSVGPSSSRFQPCPMFSGQTSRFVLGQVVDGPATQGWGGTQGLLGASSQARVLSPLASGCPGLCFWVASPWGPWLSAVTVQPHQLPCAICFAASSALLTSFICHRHLSLALCSRGCAPCLFLHYLHGGILKGR